MGFARTFAIREAPIRDHVRKSGRDDRLKRAVGEQILMLSDTNCCDRVNPGEAWPLFDAPKTFVPSRSYHSTDFAAVLWTGRRFIPLGEPNTDMFKLLRTIYTFTDSENIILSLSEDEREIAIARREWKSALDADKDLAVSFWWIYEDFTRDYTPDTRDTWPVEEVGNAVLQLMFSDWSQSADIRNHGCAISRVCTLREPEVAAFLWAGNCLRLVQEFENEKLDEIGARILAAEAQRHST